MTREPIPTEYARRMAFARLQSIGGIVTEQTRANIVCWIAKRHGVTVEVVEAEIKEQDNG